MNPTLHTISQDLLSSFKAGVDDNVLQRFEKLCDNELSIATFSFYTSVSAVFSSKIEGENIELDAYIKYKRLGAHFLPDYTRRIDDLYDAYSYARQNKLTGKKLFGVHALLTKHILKKSSQGKIRTGNMFVLTKGGQIEYVAADPRIVQAELALFFNDLKTLLALPLSFTEVLYYAAMIHLVFVKIHPFEDGNGRTARVLEKWFIAQKLGERAWFLQSEKYYYEHHQEYYANIRRLGLEYDTLDYTQSLPFLLMLPSSIRPQ